MTHKHLLRLVRTALFAALCCAATMAVHIPVPATGGYLNLGDGVVLLGALLLGGGAGAAAGGVGSMLADVLGGYGQYAIGTLLIKAACAFVAAAVCRAAERHIPLGVAVPLGCFAGECVMVLGYFGWEALVLGYGLGAAAAVPGNLAQGAAGIVVTLALYWPLRRVVRQ